MCWASSERCQAAERPYRIGDSSHRVRRRHPVRLVLTLDMQTVLITGGSGGIGFACAELFTAEGWSAVLVDNGKNEIDWDPGRYFVADVRDRDRAEEIVAGLERVDALVTCAGMSKDASITRMGDDMWRDVIDVDLTGTFNYLAACAQVFRLRRSGKAVLIGSTLAVRARRGVTNYAAAKAGVAGLARAAARDLGRYDVNVNCVAAGARRDKAHAGFVR